MILVEKVCPQCGGKNFSVAHDEWMNNPENYSDSLSGHLDSSKRARWKCAVGVVQNF
jgi:hypothetical protein